MFIRVLHLDCSTTLYYVHCFDKPCCVYAWTNLYVLPLFSVSIHFLSDLITHFFLSCTFLHVIILVFLLDWDSHNGIHRGCDTIPVYQAYHSRYYSVPIISGKKLTTDSGVFRFANYLFFVLNIYIYISLAFFKHDIQYSLHVFSLLFWRLLPLTFFSLSKVT